MKTLERLARAYTGSARFLLGMALAFLALNLLCVPIDLVLERGDPVTREYGEALIDAAYPGRSPAEVAELLDETWSRHPAYEPFTQFTERPFSGRYVNVSEHGFRLSADQGPWPPASGDLNVFFFGGSTLFGNGLADGETVVSQARPRLAALAPGRRVRVYNFGRAAFYSAQERVLFTELLVAGRRPDLAIFVDGLNDFYMDEPNHSARLRRLFDDRPLPLAARLARKLPVLRVAFELQARAHGRRLRAAPGIDPAWDRPELVAERIDRYLANVRMTDAIARAHGVVAVFVLQPVPTYQYDLGHHPFAAWSFEKISLTAYGYPELERRWSEIEPARGIWAAGIQQGLEKPLYVDQVHYNARMAGLLAAHVAGTIERQGWWPAEP